VGDVYRKVMGDAPLAYVETAGGVRVAEDDVVAVGKNDVRSANLDTISMLTTPRSCRLKSGVHRQESLMQS
jgi:hypothetical protein